MLFALLEDPVFYNTTPNDKRYGKMGQFYFSNSITPSQKNAILTFAEKISDYQIFIFYDIQIIEGEITWQTKSNMNQKNNAEFMQNFLNQGLIKIKEDNIKKAYKIQSIKPYFLAASASIKLSRSVSFSIVFKG